MARHLMIAPALSCPAECKYCFGPHESSQIMSRDVIEAIVQWQRPYDDRLEVTFHGGEPLAAGISFYRIALPALKAGLSARRVRFAMQSNLWLLTGEMCKILKQYGVSVGTSLDGPEHINDAQRGNGYFQRTMRGIELARSHGIDVGCICTFTRQSSPYLGEILDFFMGEGLNFTIHASLPSLRHPDANAWAITPEAHGKLLTDGLDLYLKNVDLIKIGTLDSMCRSVTARQGGICTFGDCLGEYLAIGPDGAIYPCQRFVGMPEYSMGNVKDMPSDEDLHRSAIWRMFKDRQEHVKEECGDCAYFDFCLGGCPYNALAAGDGRFSSLKDPHCHAYKQAFKRITDQALEEVFSEENLRDVINNVDGKKGLLRRGKLLSIMRGGPHPYETARHARRILASVALASTDSPEEATAKMQSLGLLPDNPRSLLAMRLLYDRLNGPVKGLNNLYLHVTFACNLRCTHCYADAGTTQGALPVETIIQACREAAKLGFRHAVITGGEPLVHPERDRLLDGLAAIRGEVKPMLTVLRTNLAVGMDNALLKRVGYSTDEVVVSVDGDRETHNARRGSGSYDLTVNNLRALKKAGYGTNLSLAAVLPLEQASGEPGNRVRELAGELGVRRTRFRPLLPLGRGGESMPEIVPETIWAHMDPRDMVEYGINPTASCGIGQNLYVEPDGSAYPCYAWHGRQWYLGSILDCGLGPVLASGAFRNLGKHTVNTNRQCSKCELRYLCGGACRAWNRQPSELQNDLDTPPVDCSALYKRASSLLSSALERLGIPEESWRKSADRS